MSTQNLLTLTRHEEYYISSADLSILVEHVQFRVHRYFFERESAYFRKELTTPASPGVAPHGSNDSNAFILEGVTPLEFAKFLWVFYNPRYSLYHAPVSDWATILRLANTWLFPQVKHLAVRELEKKPPAELSDVHRIALYHANAVDRNLLVPRYAALCARPEPLTVEEGMALGMETALMIAAGREEARSRLPSGGRSPLEVTVRGEELWKVIRELFRIAPKKEEEDKLDAEVEVVKEETVAPSTTGGLAKSKPEDKPTQAPPTPSKAKPAKTPAMSTAMATPPQTAQTPPTPMVPPTPTATTQKGQQPAGTPQPPPAQQQAQQQQQGKKNKGKNQQLTPADKKAAKAAKKEERTTGSAPPSEVVKATEAAKDGGNEGVVPPTPAAGQQEGQVSAQMEAEEAKQEGQAGGANGEVKKESGPEGTDGEKKTAEGEVKIDEEAKEKEAKKEEEKTEKTDAPASVTAEPAPGDAATTTPTSTTTTTATTTKDDTPPPPPANDDKKTDTTTITDPIPSPTASKPPSPIAKSPVNPTTPSTSTNTNDTTTTPAPSSEPLINLSNGSDAGAGTNGSPDAVNGAPSQDPVDPASPPRLPPKLNTLAPLASSLASADANGRPSPSNANTRSSPANANSANNVSSPSLIDDITFGWTSMFGSQRTPQSANKTSGGGGGFQWGLGPGGYPN